MVVSENQVKCLVCVICKEIIKDEGENLRGDLGILAVTAWKLAKALANGGVIPEPEGKRERTGDWLSPARSLIFSELIPRFFCFFYRCYLENTFHRVDCLTNFFPRIIFFLQS